MRKRLFIYVFIVGLLSLCFIACEKNSEDILKGTWMSEDWNSSATAEEIYDMTYVFDGKGNYTFTSNSSEGIKTTNGTYTIENETLVRTFYTKHNLDGESIGEGSDVLTLDRKSTPMTLTSIFRAATGIELGVVVFVKQ